jgi:hypothetical protein
MLSHFPLDVYNSQEAVLIPVTALHISVSGVAHLSLAPSKKQASPVFILYVPHSAKVVLIIEAQSVLAIGSAHLVPLPA